MASFALGLTKTAVDRTLSRVRSAIKEEAKLKDSVQDELIFITDEFQAVRAFLSVANKEQARNEMTKTWMRQLRELAFDVEDCVEFVVHLDNKKILGWLWRVLPSGISPPRHLDEAAEEIRKLKARVGDVCHRAMRYQLITDPDSHSNAMTPLTEQAAPATACPCAFDNLCRVWEDAGKVRDIEGLHQLVAHENSELQVISVWGSESEGDLGTITSIIGKAYCDRDICQEFKTRAWVKMAHPFNPDEFVKSLLTQFLEANIGVYSRIRMKLAMARGNNLKKAQLMQELLQDKRYLLVLEGVPTVAEWDDIKMYLPDCRNGSRIIVSTHDLEIAFVCTGRPYLVSELRRFSQGHSLCAVFKVSEGRQIIVDELKWKIPGTISVWGNAGTSFLIENVYRGIKNKWKECDGLDFEAFAWVHIPDNFELADISQQLYLDLSSSDRLIIDDQTNNVKGISLDDIEGPDIIQRCCMFLREKNCLVVINGPRFIKDWNSFKATFLSEPIKGCIIVVTREESVAKHCADHQYQVFKINDDLETNATEMQHCGYRENSHRSFISRRQEARCWIKKFELPLDHQELGLGLALLVGNSKDSGVVSVWGISGLWKSSLVKKCYYHHMLRLKQSFKIGNESLHLSIERNFTAYSWVSVTRPFSLVEFSRHLLLDFYSDDLEKKERVAIGIMQGQDLIEQCCKLLRQEKYFIVIDTLKTTEEWDLIKGAFFPDNINGCVVVITHEAKVACHCAPNESNRVNVKCIQADLSLFKKYGWSQKELTHDEMDLAKQVLSKCGGLPEVIAAVGEYCKQSKDGLKNISQNFMSRMQNYVQGIRTLKGPFSWMQSYFEASSDKLKPCIFYLSVFPVGQHFRRRRILRRWIAEGYSSDKDGITAEEDGRNLFLELIKLSIIQNQHTPSKTLHQFNGFFHEYVMSRPMDDNLVFALEGHCTLSSGRIGQRHLTIRSSWDRDEAVFQSISISRLRSLTVFGAWKPFLITPDMKLLRVLDLENSLGVANDDLEQIAKLVPRLKFLSVRGCTEITLLPASLGGLRHLQTLDARHTSVVALPHAIIKLRKLQDIHVGNTEPWDSTYHETVVDDVQAQMPGKWSRPQGLEPSRLAKRICRCIQAARSTGNGGVKVPRGIGQLTALETFGVVSVSGAAGRKVISKELKRLTQLRKLVVSGINQENCEEFFSAISGHAHLESLSVRLDKNKRGDFCYLDGISEPPRTVKSFRLYGHVHRLPAWMSELNSLEKVDFEMSILKQEDMSFFTPLPELRPISGRISVKPIGVSELNFGKSDYPHHYWCKQFRVFRIVCTSRLKLNFDDYITSNTERLVLHCSAGSSLRISGLENLSVLKEVWLKGSYSDEVKQHLKQQLDKHHNEPELRLEQPRFNY